MPSLAIMGIKQGVGATTVTATLATQLALQGQEVLAIDLCDDNALRLHLGMPWADPGGLLGCFDDDQDWRQATWRSPEGVYFLPLGRGEPDTLPLFLTQHPGWLRQQLGPLHDSTHERWLLIEIPPKKGVRLNQTLELIQQLVLVTAADPAAQARLAEWWPFLSRKASTGQAPDLTLALNRYIPGIPLQDDILELLTLRYGDRHYPRAIPEDPRVAEALAQGCTIATHAPESAAATRIGALALWLKGRLHQQVQGI